VRILYHHRTQAEDGQAVHVRALIAAFAAEGHDVREVGLVQHTAGGGAARPASAGRRRWGWVTRLPRFARELAEYAYSVPGRGRILRAAGGFEPDFVYERYAFGNTAGLAAARRLGKPLVLEVNSPMVLELERTRGLSFPRLARRTERHVFQNADRVCVVTAVLRDMLREMGVAAERLVVTPNGVDLARYDHPDRAAARAIARADLGLAADGGELVLGFVGFYRTWHRLDLAIDALARPRSGPAARARLVLIGSGPAGEELAAHAAARGVRDRVTFAGPRPHAAIPDLLPAFDVALVPAINPYASPLKLHEYMAASLPAIAPDQPNLREVLTDGVDALLVPAGDGAAFAAALERLAESPELRARLGAQARRTVVERDLTWRGNARRVVAAAREVLA
jgi:glycosyltransferase involved in cell wall biosynthesis